MPPRRHPAITVPRLAITAAVRVTDPAAIQPAALTSGDRLAPVRPPRRWRPYAWAAALLLHAAVIGLFFITLRERMPAQQSPPGISVVFDNGGTTQTAAPPAPHQGPDTAAQAPPPAAPPPPPETAQTQPEVNLDLPETPFAPLPQPTTQAQAQPNPVQHATHSTRPTQRYLVMNNMSLNHPAPRTPFKNGLSLDLPQSDAAAANSADVTVHGDVGADWNAELDQWVNDHKYYPDSAAEQGQQGDVEIHFVVDRNGNVTGLQMLSSSGSVFLDQAWLGLFQDAQLPRFPAGTKANNVTIDATMHFELLR